MPPPVPDATKPGTRERFSTTAMMRLITSAEMT